MLRKPLAPKHLPKSQKAAVRERAMVAARPDAEAEPALRPGLKILGREKPEPVHARKRAERRLPC